MMENLLFGKLELWGLSEFRFRHFGCRVQGLNFEGFRLWNLVVLGCSLRFFGIRDGMASADA